MADEEHGNRMVQAAARRAELLAYFNGPEGDKPHSLGEIAEHFDWGVELTRTTLKALRDGNLVDVAGSGGPGNAFTYARLGSMAESDKSARKAAKAKNSGPANGAFSWADVKNMVAARERAITGVRETIAQYEITRAELFGRAASVEQVEVPKQIEVLSRTGRTVRETNPEWHELRAAKAAKKKPAKKARARRTFSPEQKANVAKKALAMREAGKEWAEIESKFGVVHSLLRSWIAEYGNQPAAKKAA